MIVLWLSLPGCSFYHYVGYNARHELWRSWENCHEERRRHELAEAAWARYEPKCARSAHASSDFAAGFCAGYADYLVYNGAGEPPLAPPTKYWAVSYQNPEGRAALLAWNNGFRVGASVARDDGLHEYRIIPVPQPVYETSGDFRGTAPITRDEVVSESQIRSVPQTSQASVDPFDGQFRLRERQLRPVPQPLPEMKVNVSPITPVSWQAEPVEGHK